MTRSAAKTRLAMIGAGMASAPHLASLQALAHRVEVAWVVGQSDARIAAAAARLPGARTSTSLDDVLADDGVAAAIVLTPPNTHLELVTRLAAAGKHVLLEKPLERDSGRAKRLVETCAAAGVRMKRVVAPVERHHALSRKRQRDLCELIDGHVVGIGPQTKLRVVVQFVELELIAVVGAQRIGRRRDGDALIERREQQEAEKVVGNGELAHDPGAC